MASDWNPRRGSSFARQVNSLIQRAAQIQEEQLPKTITDCVIVDVYSGEENEADELKPHQQRHVWWVLETAKGNRYTVECGHDYDNIQSNIGNVHAQIGRKATIHYRGVGKNSVEKGYAEIQADRDSYMPNPTGESIPFSIGALGGIFDEEALFKSMNVGYESKNLGPKV